MRICHIHAASWTEMRVIFNSVHHTRARTHFKPYTASNIQCSAPQQQACSPLPSCLFHTRSLCDSHSLSVSPSLSTVQYAASYTIEPLSFNTQNSMSITINYRINPSSSPVPFHTTMRKQTHKHACTSHTHMHRHSLLAHMWASEAKSIERMK